MEHRSLIWGLDDGWMGDGISSLGTTCHQITSRVGGKMWTPWCVELKSHAYHFVFVSVLVFVFVFDLSSGTLRSRVVGVRYVHPGVQLESHAYHLSQPGGRGGPPAGLWNIICHLKSHKLIVITPGTLFISSAWSSWSSSLWMWSLGKERMWRGFDCYQVWWALDAPVILLLIPSNSNLNWIYPIQHMQAPDNLMLFLVLSSFSEQCFILNHSLDEKMYLLFVEFSRPLANKENVCLLFFLKGWLSFNCLRKENVFLLFSSKVVF